MLLGQVLHTTYNLQIKYGILKALSAFIYGTCMTHIWYIYMNALKIRNELKTQGTYMKSWETCYINGTYVFMIMYGIYMAHI